MEREEYQLKQHVPDAWLRQLSPTQMFVVYVCVHELPTYGKDKNVYHLPKHFLYVTKRVTHVNILVASLMALQKSATCARTKGAII